VGGQKVEVGGAQPHPGTPSWVSVVADTYDNGIGFHREIDANPVRVPVTDSIIDGINDHGVKRGNAEIWQILQRLVESDVDDSGPVIDELGDV